MSNSPFFSRRHGVCRSAVLIAVPCDRCKGERSRGCEEGVVSQEGAGGFGRALRRGIALRWPVSKCPYLSYPPLHILYKVFREISSQSAGSASRRRWFNIPWQSWWQKTFQHPTRGLRAQLSGSACCIVVAASALETLYATAAVGDGRRGERGGDVVAGAMSSLPSSELLLSAKARGFNNHHLIGSRDPHPRIGTNREIRTRFSDFTTCAL